MSKVSKKGFTIIELIFVLCILAIIFAIAIPLFPTISQHMKIRTDKVSAANIANSVKGWYSDYSTDNILKNSEAFLENKKELTEVGRKSIELSKLEGLSNYIDVVNTKPCSLVDENKVTVDNQKFFVSFSDEGENAKVIVTVGTEGINISNDATVNYDGTFNGIIYIGK